MDGSVAVNTLEEIEAIAIIKRRWPNQPIKLYRIDENRLVVVCGFPGWAYHVRADGLFSKSTGGPASWAFDRAPDEALPPYMRGDEAERRRRAAARTAVAA